MGIDSMRVGGGRCPPLLVGGLLIACLMLICNWWTLSSENIELVRQIDDLNEQFKISIEERDQCVTLRGNLEQRFKHAEDEVASLHVRLMQQTDSISICKSELESLKKLDDTKSATLETLRQNKNSIDTQLDVQQDENKKLQEEIAQLKDEIEKLKFSCNKTFEKKFESIPQSTVIDKTQLGPVPDSAIKVSVAGQRGLKYHDIPILPKDPPGAVRLSPRLSVTMLKARGTSKQEKTQTSNSAILQQVQEEKLDELDTSKLQNAGSTDGNIESDRDQQMIQATEV